MTHSNGLPPLEAFEAVQAAARLGSFSAAALELGITHGAVSRRVALAERWAGLRLFARHGRGVRVTLDGARVVERLEHAIALLEDSRARDSTDHGLDTIRVSVVPSFARLWLVPRLAALEGSPPDLRIDIDVDTRHTILSDARLAIRLGPGGWPDVRSIPLMDETLRPVACKATAEALGPSPLVEDIRRHPILHDASQDRWKIWLAAQGQPYRADGRDRVFPGYDLMLSAAAAGLGIAIARDPYGDDYIDKLGLVFLPFPAVEHADRFHIVVRPGSRRPAVERLIERIRAAAVGVRR